MKIYGIINNDNTSDRGDGIKNLLDGLVVSNLIHQFIILFDDGVVEKNGGVHCCRELNSNGRSLNHEHTIAPPAPQVKR